MLNSNQKAFFALLRAGLWEKKVMLSDCGQIDFKEIYRLAAEQTVIGAIAAGLEHVVDVKFPKEDVLQFVGESLQLEQRNTAMNNFIGVVVEKLRSADIYVLLLKGQGIAQCYERPLWRACGDVDFLLSKKEYLKAIQYLTPIASYIAEENPVNLHQGMHINNWVVELHGTQNTGLWGALDRTIKDAQNEVFCEGAVRTWMNDKTQVFLPRADEDVIFVFTHILQHYYIEGIGLRQICDWCRLLWTYKETLNYELLESRIRKAGIMKEWKSFGAFAVEYLGMPAEAMPFLDVRGKIDDERCEVDKRLKRKADRILAFVMESGNFGHNRDISYKQKYPFVIRYAMSFWLYTKLAIQRFSISPRNAIMAWWAIVKLGANAAAKAI